MTDPIYAVARSVLLDALDALGEHRESLVLVGAQAVYAHAGDVGLPIAPFTADGDLAIDTTVLRETPALEAALERAGFRRTKPEVVGVWTKDRPVEASEPRPFSVDLLVPSSSTQRAARLPGHDLRVARNVGGLEGALVDHDPMTIRSLTPDDQRAFELRVAGPAALVVAKVHKIHERTATSRLKDKDAFDVFRLLRRYDAEPLALRLQRLLADERSASTAKAGIEYFAELFTSRRGLGVEMTVRSIEGLADSEEIAASCVALAGDVVALLEG